MIAIVGGGAAGLATAIFARRRGVAGPIGVVDGARSLGAKILVSGGARCNVTNRRVEATDFNGGSRPAIRRVLAGFGVEATTAFFREIGVPLREEENGKLFPTTGRARTVLDALLGEAHRQGVEIKTSHRVLGVRAGNGGFTLETTQGPLRAERVVLATGGLSLPKTGSDGGGYALAASMGHSNTPLTPALVPLVLEGGLHAALSGVAVDVEIAVRAAGARAVRVRGPLLFTHFGVSGPAVLDASRHWCQARAAGAACTTFVSFLPGATFEEAEAWLLDAARVAPSRPVRGALGERLPAALAGALVAAAGIDQEVRLGRLTREARRALVTNLVSHPLPVRESRGYNFAEVTAGGVPLTEVDSATMASRRCPGLHLVGEILDVDGRIGGFNFQWAWSSAWAAAGGLRGGV